MDCKDIIVIIVKKTFSPTTKSVFYNTHKIKIHFRFIELMLSGVSLRKTGTIYKINKFIALIWSHKIMQVLVRQFEHNRLNGIIELDDTFLNNHLVDD
jgi:transposase-like protein